MSVFGFLIDLPNSFLSLFLSVWLFASVGKSKYDIKINSLCIFVVTIAYSVLKQTIHNNILESIFVFSIVFGLSFLYECEFLYRISYSIIFCVISYASEIISAMLFSIVFNIHFDLEQNLLLMSEMFAKLLVFLTIILGRLNRKLPYIRILNKANWYILFFPMSTFLIIILQSAFLTQVEIDNDYYKLAIAACYTLLIVSNVLVFDYFNSIYKNTLNESKITAAEEIIKKQTEQYQTLKDYQGNIAKIRHDHNNFCIGVLYAIESGNTSEAINQIKKECDVNYIDAEYAGNLIHTVVDIKKQTALDLGIEIDFEYRELQKLLIPSVDMSIILGNAIDNAIEATHKLSDTSKKRIRLFVALKNDTVIITIKNPTISEIDPNNLTTEKEDRENHGFGIISMKQIAAKYNGEVLFSYNNGVFVTSIIMRNGT